MPNQTRQLAAIMFTDIVGYTALMGEDEEKAFRLLKKNRHIQKPLIEKHGGIWLKEMGDGVLASFSSVSSAVYCAKEIQESCMAESDLNLRIGIHLGEVIIEDNDVFGDGVNIASRLEPLAPAGGVVISEAVYNNIYNKEGLEAKFQGEKLLKNVKHPVQVYLLEVEGAKTKTATTSSHSGNMPGLKSSISNKIILIALGVIVVLALGFFFTKQKKQVPAKDELVVIDKSIAILPFKDDSKGGDKMWFCNGMMDEIINHLQEIDGLDVRSRTDIEVYRNNTKSISDIAEELKVAFIVEGSLKNYAGSFRLIIKLVHASSGKQLWSEPYEGIISNTTLDDQIIIAKKVASELDVEISPNEERKISKRTTNNLTAYEYYLKGQEYLSRLQNEENMRHAAVLFEKAIELDSIFAKAWLGLAMAEGTIYWRYHDRSLAQYEKFNSYYDKAVSLDPELLVVRLAKISELKLTDQLNKLNELLKESPNNDTIIKKIGGVYSKMGRFEKALEYVEKAIELNPTNFHHRVTAGVNCIYLGRYKKAEVHYMSAIDLQPKLDFARVADWIYLNMGEVKMAREYVDRQYKKHGEMYWIRSKVERIDRNFENSIAIIDEADTILQSYHSLFRPKSLVIGLIYFSMSDLKSAREQFQIAREILEKKLRDDPDDSRVLSSLGIAYAGVGMHKEAIEAGEKALSVMNFSINPAMGNFRERDMAIIYLITGEFEKSIQKLDYMIWHSGYISVEYLKLDPLWDPLREMESFKALINNPEYQVNL